MSDEINELLLEELKARKEEREREERKKREGDGCGCGCLGCFGVLFLMSWLAGMVSAAGGETIAEWIEKTGGYAAILVGFVLYVLVQQGKFSGR